MTNDERHGYPSTTANALVPASSSSSGSTIDRDWVALMGPAVTLAQHVADTAFVPKGLRGNAPAIVAAIMYGDELGLGPMQALARIAVIDGKPSLAAETQRALVFAAGHELWIDEATSTRVTVSGKRLGSTRTSSVTWTMDDAKKAGLSAKPSWRAYPRAMLTARATAELVRTVFADVTGGLMAAEEVDDGLELDEAAEPKSPSSTRRRKKTSEATTSEVVEAADVEALVDEADGERLLAELQAEAEAPGELGEQRIVGLDETVADLELERERERERADAEAGNVAELERLAGEAKAAADEPTLMSDPQRRKMNALFRERDVTSRPARLEYLATVIGRAFTTSSELTLDEAGRVIEALEQWDPTDPSSSPFPVDDGIPF